MPGTIPLTAQGMTLLAGPKLVSVCNDAVAIANGGAAGGQNMAVLLNNHAVPTALHPNLKQLKVIPQGTVYLSEMGGNANATTCPLSAYPMTMHIRKHEADQLKWFAAANVAMIVIQEG